MSGRYLIVDTSTPAGSLALCENGRVLVEYRRSLPGTHTEWLLAAMDQLLAQAGISPRQLEALAAVVGPGSFTGLRVGLATVKGVALAADLPVVPLSSLELLACAVPYAAEPVCALLDARKSEVYFGLYDTSDGCPVAVADDEVLPPAELSTRLREPVLMVGDGAWVYRDQLADLAGRGCRFASPCLGSPRAALGAELVVRRLKEKCSVSAASLVPRYLRASEAERARNKGDLPSL